MSRIVELLCSRRLPHVAALALISIGFAGCSGDMSTRLSQESFSNPFASQPEAIGTVPPAPIERREPPRYYRPQPQYQSSALPPPITAPQSNPTASAGVSGGGRGLASYAPPTHPPLEATGTVALRPVAAIRSPGPGGTTIIVGTSDTLDTLSRRYNVSPAAILQANGYKGPRTLSPGQQLIIPRQTAVGAVPALAAPASKPVALAAAPAVHVVNPGDTLLSVARRNHVPLSELARANSLEPTAKLRLGMKLTVPGAKTAAVAPAAQPAPVAVAAQPVAPVAAPSTKMAAAGG
ncbi:MAG TPA: LysM domain-containing protein, partial [Bradyrhizobium sp.]|nr:LysM domain-containing protein [Bradyrhizobium sp.]